MNIERMERLLEVMQAVAVKDMAQGHTHFNWGSWFMDYDAEYAAVRFARRRTAKNPVEVKWSCNTQACVLGHAAFDPEFRKQGLTIAVLPGETSAKVLMLAEINGKLLPSYQEENAGKYFFDLTWEQTWFLFFGPQDAPPQEAIDRIKYLLATQDGFPCGVKYRAWRDRQLTGPVNRD